ncbi:hypothetical protein CDV50_10305 [Haematobacter massiliensis]|uniref:HNH endonuclease n=1 Tax=Haematobacter massiliensis TaxID=195105 RepID=UPI000B4A2E7C|nr:hypothetical protein CDV50_10305 [Haematobacter massiliensis]
MANDLCTILGDEQQRLALWARLDGKVKFLPAGCHVWQGAKTPKGYGVIGFGPKAQHKTLYVHRLAIWRRTGVDPSGQLVMHSCDNPSCCNPEHLSIGTPNRLLKKSALGPVRGT